MRTLSSPDGPDSVEICADFPLPLSISECPVIHQTRCHVGKAPLDKRSGMRSYRRSIEDPSSKLQGMFCLTAVLRSDRKERCHFIIRSLLRFKGLFVMPSCQQETTVTVSPLRVWSWPWYDNPRPDGGNPSFEWISPGPNQARDRYCGSPGRHKSTICSNRPAFRLPPVADTPPMNRESSWTDEIRTGHVHDAPVPAAVSGHEQDHVRRMGLLSIDGHRAEPAPLQAGLLCPGPYGCDTNHEQPY